MGILEIIGPIMIGPSSSHTAGAARLGKLARYLFGGDPIRAEIVLSGSFAATGPGHGTPEAILGGILGLDPDDPALVRSQEMAVAKGLEATFRLDPEQTGPANTAMITLQSEVGRQVEISGSSVGGGKIRLLQISGFEVEMDIELPFLAAIYQDRPGMVAAVSHVLAEYHVNIACMRIFRKARGEKALMAVETDEPLPGQANEAICSISGIDWVGFAPQLK